MELLFSEHARKELKALPRELKPIFLKHLEKIKESPPRGHMKHGIPCHVEKVTKQARIIYQKQNQNIHIIHCFKNHKEYESWYKTYK